MKFVISTLNDTTEVEKLHPLFAKALAFLKREDLKALAPGRYEIEGDRCYAIVADSPLKAIADGKLEVHERYIDIQAPVAGPETLGVGPVPETVTSASFNKEKDIAFYDGPFGTVDLCPGEFAVFYPRVDGHAPCLSRTGAKPAQRKVIVKVLEA